MTTTTSTTTEQSTTTDADRATMIRPGLMVSLKSACRGGVSYQRVDLDAAKAGITPTVNDADEVTGYTCTTCERWWGAGEPEAHAEGCLVAAREVARWETTKVMDDPVERRAGEQARSKAIRAIRKHCARTAFGLLCTQADEAKLDAGIAEARKIVADFNATANTTHVAIFVLKGRVASDDREAARAIAAEVRELMDDMEGGIKAMDPEAIRQAADKAKEIGAMLGAEQADKVAEAVTQARKAAKAIVARVQKGGEDAAAVLQELQRGAIQKARIAFLDLDVPEVQSVGDALPAVDVARVAAIDVDDDSEAVPADVDAAAEVA